MSGKKTGRTKGSDRRFNGLLTVITTIWLIIVMYPLIYVVSSSFSSGNAVSTGKVLLWPVDLSVIGYRLTFGNRRVWTGYANTILYALAGTALNVVLTILVAYPLSRKTFQGRKFLNIIFLIPMFFGGGLIPTYILVSGLGLDDTRLYMIINGAISIYNMILMRTFFQNSIPNDLLESAKIDGITDSGYLIRIVLPLSKAIISVISLYYLVGHWNSYFTPMIYLRSNEKFPLQLVLRGIMSSTRVDASQMMDETLMAQMSGAQDVMKYALIVVSTLPMLAVYPFVQKFFEKGVMIGSIKG